MKYRIAKELKKIFLIIYVIMMIISSYGLNKCSVIAANDSNGLNGVLFIGDSRLGGTVKSKLEAEGATVKQVDSSSPSSGWEEVCSSGSGTVRGRSNESISLPDKSGVTAVAVDLGVNDTNSFGSYKNVISNLKSRYPGVTIYAMSIYYCGTKRSGYSSLNSAIDTYNSNIKNYCSGNVKYADVITDSNINYRYDVKNFNNNSIIVPTYIPIPIILEKNNIKKELSNSKDYKLVDNNHFEEITE